MGQMKDKGLYTQAPPGGAKGDIDHKCGALSNQGHFVHIHQAIKQSGDYEDPAGDHPHGVFDVCQAVERLANLLAGEGDKERKEDDG